MTKSRRKKKHNRDAITKILGSSEDALMGNETKQTVGLV